MRVDPHHIYKQQYVRKKGKCPEWIDSPLNVIRLSRTRHDHMHAASNNKKAMPERERVLEELWLKLIDFNTYEAPLFTSSELIAIKNVYKYCTIHGYNKEKKPGPTEIKVYELCCKKMQEYYKKE